MNHHSTLQRGACTLAAAATLGLALAGPASARPDPGEPVPTPSGSVHVIETPVDDNAVELLQVGGGLAAGLALAGAAAALASRRRHATPHFA